MEGMHGAGKGDTYRPVDYKKWSDNWDKIFGKKPRKKDNNEQDNGDRPRKHRTNRRKGG